MKLLTFLNSIRTLFRVTSSVWLAMFAIGCGSKPTPAVETSATGQKADSPKQTVTDVDRLQGSWKAVSGEANGKKIPEDELKEARAIFHGNHMIFKEKESDSGESMTFQLDTSKSPKTMDSVLERIDEKTKEIVKDKAELQIYELNGDDLKLAFIKDGDAPRPTSFQGQPASNLVVIVLKRDKTAAAYQPEKVQDSAEFPEAVVGKWKLVSHNSFFPLVGDSEFTKDGRVLIFRSKNSGTPKEWIEMFKYKFEKAVLILTPTEKNDVIKTEERVRVKTITKEEFVAVHQSGKLIRMK